MIRRWARKPIVFRVLFGAIILAALLLSIQAWRASGETVVIVEWTTASELDTAGFHLYRGEESSGPFTRVNPSLIPASSDPLAGAFYEYKDQDVLAGQTYYYELESVEFDGAASRFGPIEVKARRAGRLELLGFLAFAGVGILGMLVAASRRPASKPEQPSIAGVP